MASELENIFRSLGLAQYLDSFVEQGFDTWDIILDIQESDLDALGVKLGHRRKLQRRIANARGITSGNHLDSPIKASSDDGTVEKARSESGRDHNEHVGVAKRKYRRHPKADDNAPERPPSAYVLFSNKMREDLKSQNLTFTEIAKLVGENWQNLASAEKEAYESQANCAKEKYHRDLVEYKKTPEYRRYAKYLQDFKEKQAKQNHTHEVSKRNKGAEPARLRHSSSSSANNGTTGISSGNTSGSLSGSERLQGSEPPPTKRERLNSFASMGDSHHSAAVPSQFSNVHPFDDMRSSNRGHPVHNSTERYIVHPQHGSAWTDQPRAVGDQGPKTLPSLSDLMDESVNSYPPGFVAANHSRRPAETSSPTLPRAAPPTFQHEVSTDSSGSLSSAASYGRHADGSLPIHTLLAGRGGALGRTPPLLEHSSTASSSSALSSSADHGKSEILPPLGARGYVPHPAPSSFEYMKVEQAGDGDVVMTAAEPFIHDSPTQHRSRDSFDGMNALLQAGEIVGRRIRD